MPGARAPRDSVTIAPMQDYQRKFIDFMVEVGVLPLLLFYARCALRRKVHATHALIE